MHDVGEIASGSALHLDRRMHALCSAQRLIQLVAKGPEPNLLDRLHAHGGLERRREADRAGNVLRAASPAGFLPATEHESVEGRAVAQIQRADAFSRADFMAGKRRRVAIPFAQVNLNLAERLRGVGVKQRPAAVSDLRKRGHVLNASHFGIRRHNADENRVAVASAGKRLGCDEACRIRRKLRHAPAQRRQVSRGREHGVVFDGRHDDMRGELPRPGAPARRHRSARQTQKRGVVGLGGAAGEDDLVGTRSPKRGGNLLARPLKRGEGGAARQVQAVRVRAHRKVRAAAHLVRRHRLGGLFA